MPMPPAPAAGKAGGGVDAKPRSPSVKFRKVVRKAAPDPPRDRCSGEEGPGSGSSASAGASAASGDDQEGGQWVDPQKRTKQVTQRYVPPPQAALNDSGPSPFGPAAQQARQQGQKQARIALPAASDIQQHKQQQQEPGATRQQQRERQGQALQQQKAAAVAQRAGKAKTLPAPNRKFGRLRRQKDFRPFCARLLDKDGVRKAALAQRQRRLREQEQAVAAAAAAAAADAPATAAPPLTIAGGGPTGMAGAGRSAAGDRKSRSEQRALLRGEDVATDDAFKWKNLKARAKGLKFGRSPVHAWGLFAKEHIQPDEFVIEYVGERIRREVAERREVEYERCGLGSSYLFRVDGEWVVDATKKGGLARFINHSCDPNCVTRIIEVAGTKHIVIHSKRAIQPGEELCYDYKFELEAEDKKVPCYCGARTCRNTMN